MESDETEEQNARIRISGSLIARNALLNLIGQAVRHGLKRFLARCSGP
jgi:hypothetical protein